MNIIDDMEAIQKRLAEIEKAKLSADEMASLDTEGKLPEPGWPVPVNKPPIASLTFPEVPEGWHPPLAIYCDKGEIVDLTASPVIWAPEKPTRELAEYRVQCAEARIRLYTRMLAESSQQLLEARGRLAQLL